MLHSTPPPPFRKSRVGSTWHLNSTLSDSIHFTPKCTPAPCRECRSMSSILCPQSVSHNSLSVSEMRSLSTIMRDQMMSIRNLSAFEVKQSHGLQGATKPLYRITRKMEKRGHLFRLSMYMYQVPPEQLLLFSAKSILLAATLAKQSVVR